MDLLLLNSKFLVTVDQDRRIIRDGAIAVDEGKIVDVGKTGELKRKHGPADRTVDARDCVVIPGMMNCHCHTTDQLTRGLTDNVTLGTWITERVSLFESGLSADDVYVSAAACFVEGIKNGVTMLADPGGPHMERVVQAAKDTGARAVLAERLDDIPHRGARGAGPKTSITDDVVKKGEEFVLKHNGSAGGRVKAWFSLRTERTTSDALGRAVQTLAEKHRVGIETHMVNNSDAVVRHKELFRGKLPLKRYQEMGLLGPNLLLTHCNWLNDEEVGLVAKSGASVCATPTSNIAVGSGGLKFGNTEKFLSAGVNVSLGCSGSSASNFLDMLRVAYCLASAQDLQCDPTLYPPELLFEMLTINGARSLLSEGEVGKKADIVVVDTKRPEWTPLFNPVSNLVLSSSGDAVKTVVIDGKVVMEDRKLATLDEHDLLRRAQRTAESVASKTGAEVYGRPSWKVV